MFLADTHMHSAASFDSTTPRREMARAAAAQGLRLICFTDHHDVIDGKSQLCPTFDWPTARAEHQAAVAEQIPGLELCYGLELGNAFGDYAAAENSLKEPGLDYVIGSVHNTGKALGYLDYYYQTYTPELAAAHLEDYFTSMLELVQWGKFDSLGHIPYPLRYMRDRDGCDVGLGPYWNQIDGILRQIIASGIALEVNTKGFRQARSDYAALLERYRALGGEMVTCGGDAHRPSEVGETIREGYELIQEKGFRYVTVYRRRKPNLIPL
ncbi:MAG: histidinol-phosphatase HisJ family protein [Clostridiales bacterium]|nr:histidinol-phosphatase HisJ family protein [Clostridiales bacterium]